MRATPHREEHHNCEHDPTWDGDREKSRVCSHAWFTDQPASHAVAHATGDRCPCHGKTEAEIATPYALLAFSLPVLALAALAYAWLFL